MFAVTKSGAGGVGAGFVGVVGRTGSGSDGLDGSGDTGAGVVAGAGSDGGITVMQLDKLTIVKTHNPKTKMCILRFILHLLYL